MYVSVKAAFAAYSGATAPDCDYVGEIAVDTNTDAIYVCTVTGAPGGTWVSADNNPTDGTSVNNTLRWDGSAWVESANFTNDSSGNIDAAGTITAGSGNNQITNAAGLLDAAVSVIGDANTAYTSTTIDGALDEISGTTGAGIVGIADAGGYTAQTTVEGALQELYSIGPAAGTSDSNTLRWDAANSAWEEDSNLTVNDATNAVAITNGTSFTANGATTIGDGGDAFDVNATSANWDLTSLDFDIAGNADILATGTFSIDGTGASNVSADTGNLTLSTTTSGDLNLTSVDDIVFTDQYDSLTFAQTSAGNGDDLLNGVGEIFESTGTIGSTIGAGETSTSLIHAINSVGTYATTIGAGANDDIDDVYNNGASGTYFADVDTVDTGYNVTSADGDGFSVQNSGTNFADFTVNASDQSIIDFDMYDFTADATNGISLDAAAASNFTTSAGDLTLSATTNSVIVDGGEAATDAVRINASNAAGGIDIDAGTAGVAIDTTGAFSFQGAADSDITTTGTSDITLTAGDDMIFDDAQLTGVVQLTDTATDWNATFASDGIIDNINSFTSTATGEGASNVGIEDAGGNFTATNVEGALTELAGLTPAAGTVTNNTLRWDGSDWVESANFTNDASGNIDAAGTITAGSGNNQITTAAGLLDAAVSVIGDANTKYTSTTIDGALDEISGTTGATIVGITDAGGYFTGTDVETALQELGASTDNNNEDLRFYPEYPDTVVLARSGTNRGTLESEYDDTNDISYYNWTSRRGATQDIDIQFHFPLPTDFVTSGDLTYQYRTGTTTEADNDVEIRMYNVTDAMALCGSDTTNGTAGTWTTGTIAAATLTAGCANLDPGDIILIEVNLSDNSGAADYADVGYIDLDYSN